MRRVEEIEMYGIAVGDEIMYKYLKHYTYPVVEQEGLKPYVDKNMISYDSDFSSSRSIPEHYNWTLWGEDKTGVKMVTRVDAHERHVDPVILADFWEVIYITESDTLVDLNHPDSANSNFKKVTSWNIDIRHKTGLFCSLLISNDGSYSNEVKIENFKIKKK